MPLRTSTAGTLSRKYIEENMLGINKQAGVSLLWVGVNFVGILAGTLVAFFLYTFLTLNNNITLDAVKLLAQLAICGAVQGFIVAGLQTIVLLLGKLKLVQWLVTNMLSMAAGMAAPTAYAIAIHPNFEATVSFNQYVMSGWVLSWVLAGASGGIVLGQGRSQKIRWATLNAAAYLYWGLSAAWGMRLLDAALYGVSTLSTRWGRSLLLIGLMLSIGAWLHSYVFRGVARRRNRVEI